MRLFIAILLPDNIRDYLYELQEEIGNEYAKIRWMSKKNIHLTLKFIGNVDDNIKDEIIKKLGEIKYDKFNVSLGDFGWFGGNNPSVLWTGLKDGSKAIELAKIVDSKLLDILSHDERFSSHLTIGRVKLIKSKEDFMNKLRKIRIKELGFDVEDFALMSSQLRKEGSIYNIVEKFKLN